MNTVLLLATVFLFLSTRLSNQPIPPSHTYPAYLTQREHDTLGRKFCHLLLSTGSGAVGNAICLPFLVTQTPCLHKGLVSILTTYGLAYVKIRPERRLVNPGECMGTS